MCHRSHGARVHMHPTALKRFTWALNWPSMIWCVIRFREDYQTVVRPPSANLSLFSAENHHACISFRPGIHSTIFIQFWDEFWLMQLFLELKTEFQLCCVCVLMCSVRQSDGRMNFLQILITPHEGIAHLRRRYKLTTLNSVFFPSMRLHENRNRTMATYRVVWIKAMEATQFQVRRVHVFISHI